MSIPEGFVKESELADLEKTKEDLMRMPPDVKAEVDHTLRTIDLAIEAIEHDWISLAISHKAAVTAGMDIVFDRLSR